MEQSIKWSIISWNKKINMKKLSNNIKYDYDEIKIRWNIN